MEPRRRRPPRERRLKAGKMLQWSILSESPRSCAAKACGAWVDDRKGSAEQAGFLLAKSPEAFYNEVRYKSFKRAL